MCVYLRRRPAGKFLPRHRWWHRPKHASIRADRQRTRSVAAGSQSVGRIARKHTSLAAFSHGGSASVHLIAPTWISEALSAHVARPHPNNISSSSSKLTSYSLVQGEPKIVTFGRTALVICIMFAIFVHVPHTFHQMASFFICRCKQCLFYTG